MPLIDEDAPGSIPVEKPIPVKVVSAPFRGVTVDTRYTPIRSLLTHIEGASWTVNYYSQVLGKDNALSGQNLNRPAAYQQYRLINQFELKVTTPLNTTQDQSTKEYTVTGQANVYPTGLVPNEGDCFLADVGDGREAVFEITNSESRSMFEDGAYIIDYKLVAYSEQDGRIADLNMKTVEHLVFRKDMVEYGQKALITTQENDLVNQLSTYYREMIDFYFSRFMSRDYRTLILPGQPYIIYDPFLTNVVLSMFRDELHPNIKYIRELNVSEDHNYDASNVWSALKHKRRKELLRSITKVGLVSAKAFSRDPQMNSVRYSGVEYVVYPIDQLKSIDYQHRDLGKPFQPWSITPTPTPVVDLFDLIQIDELNGLPSFDAPAINPSQQDTYVFSPQFYHHTNPGQSALELAFQNYLDDKAINMRLLLQLCVSYTSWAPLEQFYQMPFLLAMVNAAIRRM